VGAVRQNATAATVKPRQAAVLEAAQKAGLNRNITAICREADIAPSTFYRWLQNDAEFRGLWDSVWSGAIKRHLPGVVAAVIAQALKGDVKAERLVADLAGVITEKRELSGPGGTPLFDVIVVRPAGDGDGDGTEDEA